MRSVNTQQSLPRGLAVLVVTYLSVTLGEVTKAASGRARSRTQICGTLALDSLLSLSLSLTLLHRLDQVLQPWMQWVLHVTMWSLHSWATSVL